MGAFQGGLTYRQYYVTDPLPKDWKDSFQQGLTRLAFKDIELNSEEERAFGWTSALFPLDTELSTEMYLHNEYMVLAMRVDTLTVPGPLLKIQTEAEIRRIRMEENRELNRYAKAEVKERVKKALRHKMLPTIKTFDMVWNHLTESGKPGMVRFFSANEKLNLEFQELFEDTFDLRLVPDCGLTAAMHADLGLTDEQVEAMQEVHPSFFADADDAVDAMKEV